LIIPTDGPAVDYSLVKRQVLEDAQRFNIERINVDRAFQGMTVLIELQDEGLNAVEFGMGFRSFTAPCVEFQRRLLLHQINHGGNPVMRWMMNGLAVKRDESATSVSMKPVKGNPYAKIDGPVTLIMGLDGVMRYQATDFFSDGVITVRRGSA
jgi:phage terminase large subunit-like protein